MTAATDSRKTGIVSGPYKVYENAALITGVAGIADQVLVAIPIPAGLLEGKVFRVMVSFGKNGATDAPGTFSMRMGIAGTTADTQVTSFTPSMTSGQRSVGFDLWHRMASATSVNKLGGVPVTPFSNAGSATLLNAATTVANVSTQPTYITLTTTMAGATDAPQLGYVCVEIQP